jgi:hypothetical protein
MPTFLIVTAKRNINRYTVVKKKGDSWEEIIYLYGFNDWSQRFEK